MRKENAKVMTHLPVECQGDRDSAWQRYEAALAEEGLSLPVDISLLKLLQNAFGYSEFIAEQCIRQPQSFELLENSGDLFREYRYGEQLLALSNELIDVETQSQLMQGLRQYRNRQMLRLAFRDLAGWSDLGTTLEELSWLAEACIEVALSILSRWQSAEYEQSQSLIVIGMGKLGAHELNFSSDIDLIFAYPDDGETSGNGPTLENSEYFTSLGRRLIEVLQKITADGFVFRVDMRLRPFGDSGPLVMSFDMMEEYYQNHGREWERYAMIKARIVGGERKAGDELLNRLQPFVYRRYIDFSVFTAIREMKALIETEVERRDRQDNIKLGAGGIREIEFIGQVFQLVHGGRRSELQQREILTILNCLVQMQLLPNYVVEELHDAYVFLRHSEHRLQMWRDEQTHDLPKDEIGRSRLAAAMGFKSWQQYSQQLALHRKYVAAHFQQVFAVPPAELPDVEQTPIQKQIHHLWLGSIDAESAEQVLQQLGYVDATEVLRWLTQLREGLMCRTLSAQGRQRLDELIPMLIAAVASLGASFDSDADITLTRLLRFIEQVAQRSTYLVLLIENPLALSQLVRLCAASPWIANQLSQHPVILDELIDPRHLYTLADQNKLGEELATRLQAVDDDDLEQQMEVLRQFRHASVLRVAAADVNAEMPLMSVSNHLTAIAEVVLNQALAIALHAIQQRYGCLPNQLSDTPTVLAGCGFAVIAYGKFGGFELGYGSDLDLVFIHNADDDEALSDGEQPLTSLVYYSRLAQRLTRILSALTPTGMLYEVDMRLRPSGHSGLLVSQIEAFSDYQQQEAWTWEHQALVRARAITGDQRISSRFADIRAGILQRQREPSALIAEVLEMRERMRTELDHSDSDVFDLKQGLGGIVDIEFMVQYAVLRWGHEFPDLLEKTDTVRILLSLAQSGLLDATITQQLADYYRLYRSSVHQLKLQEKSAKVPASQFEAERRAVQRYWQTWFAKEKE